MRDSVGHSVRAHCTQSRCPRRGQRGGRTGSRASYASRQVFAEGRLSEGLGSVDPAGTGSSRRHVLTQAGASASLRSRKGPWGRERRAETRAPTGSWLEKGERSEPPPEGARGRLGCVLEKGAGSEGTLPSCGVFSHSPDPYLDSHEGPREALAALGVTGHTFNPKHLRRQSLHLQ